MQGLLKHDHQDLDSRVHLRSHPGHQGDVINTQNETDTLISIRKYLISIININKLINTLCDIMEVSFAAMTALFLLSLTVTTVASAEEPADVASSIILPMRGTPVSTCFPGFVTDTYPSPWYAERFW